MGTQVSHSTRSRRFGTAIALVAGLTALTITAAAASLGGIGQGDLYASGELDSVPLPLAFDHFDDCAGNLDGDLDVLGNAWLAPTTDWRCPVLQSWATNRNNASAADSATVDVGQSDLVTVTAYLSRASRLAAGAGSGIAFFHDGGTYHMYYLYERGADILTLGKVDGSGDTVIGSASLLPQRDTIELTLVISQPDLSFYADGAFIATYTMNAAELATFGSNTRFGMEADLDRRSRVDWFRVDDDS